MTFDHGDKSNAWHAYDQIVRASGQESSASRAFDQKGLYFGYLDEAFAKHLCEIVVNSEVEPRRREDTSPGFVTVKWPAHDLRALNKTSRFRHFDAEASWHLSEMLDALQDEVADSLGSPWSVLSIKAWTTPPSVEDIGMYGWHSDGFVPEIFKIMVYLVPLSKETGSFEFRLGEEEIQHRSDKAGAWALFKNTDVLHRGVPGRSEERVAIELTIARSASFDLVPRFPGNNAHWPTYPWVYAVEGFPTELTDLLAARASPDAAPPAPKSFWSRLFS